MLNQSRKGIHSAGGHGSVKANIAKAWLNLNGIATPDGAHPTGRRVSVLRTRTLGVVFTFIGVVTAYLFIVRPLEAAKRDGKLHQGLFGLIMPILLLYGGVAMLVTDVRDEKTVRAGAEGRLRLTRKGRILQGGMWAATALAVMVWYLYVRSLGLAPF